ncbi:MAG TPA: VRR-NUC domain-containing protein [Myxococcota bacterium]|nr:VRR-NUC domain-containing protein [Myxococcota bacterium]
MREKDVEQHLIGRAGTLGGAANKFTSPGRRGLMDRIVMLPVPEEHRDIVARYIRFVEVKRPGQRARKLQDFWIRVFRGYGFWAGTVSTPTEVDQLFEEMTQ